MKKIVGFIGLGFLHLMVACSSMSPTETMKPTAVTDFKSVSGKWEGLLIRDNPLTQNYDRVALVIDDTGAYDITVTRTRTRVQGASVSYDVIGVFAEKGKLVLTEGRLIGKGGKGGQATLQLYADPGSGERILRSDGKDREGFTFSAHLERTEEVPSAK